MKKNTLYCYNLGHYYIESLAMPNQEFTTKLQIVSDEGKLLTKDGEKKVTATVIEESDLMNWYEVDAPEEPIEGKIEPTE